VDWFGSVVLANIPDPDGRPCGHPHPAMVLRGPDDAGNLYLIGISTQFESPPGRLMVECPWSPGGHPETGLDRPCVLKCWWVVPFHRSQVLQYLGRMPSNVSQRALEYAITAVEEKSRSHPKPSSGRSAG